MVAVKHRGSDEINGAFPLENNPHIQFAYDFRGFLNLEPQEVEWPQS